MSKETGPKLVHATPHVQSQVTESSRRRQLLAATILAAVLSPPLLAAAHDTGNPSLNPDRVRWNRISLEAHKLFISATTTAEWSAEEQAAVSNRLIAAPDARVIAPGPDVLTLKVRAEMPGISSVTTLWMDPGTANSLQYEIRDSGRRIRERTVRFTDTGAFQSTRRPGKSDDDAVPATWTDKSSGFWDYAQRVDGAPVLDSLALLYAIAASELQQTGDRLEVLVFQARDLVRVVLSVDGTRDTRVAYEATGDDGTSSCRGSVRALRVRLAVLPFGEAPPDFDFLGLKSDIVVLVEPESRLPLRIEGKASIVGKVTSTLKKARLRGGKGCPDLR